MPYNRGIDPAAMPRRVRRLPVSPTGFPVPWFVHWNDDGTPDFRVIGRGKHRLAEAKRLCWVCGEPLGKFMSFVIGPMCAVNHVSGEPPCHHACAVFAATACPFLIRPRAKRNESEFKVQDRTVHPLMARHNPGVALVWTTTRYWLQREMGELVYLFGEPSEVLFYCEARPATRAEVDAAVAKGLPFLQADAAAVGAHAVAELPKRLRDLYALLDRLLGAPVPSLEPAA